MPFSTRNAYYLRVSNYRTIPLFLYLDERHTDWMQDQTLQRVIAELQPKIIELLGFSGTGSRTRGGGIGEKKHKVYVERGEGYQFCYFLRGTTRTEVVLLKQKSYSLRPPTPPPAPTPEPPLRSRTSSSRPTPNPSSARGRNSRTRSRLASIRPTPNALAEDEDEPLAEIGAEEGDEPDERGDGGLREEGEAEEEDVKPDISEESEERGIKDYKPDVSVTYKGFGTSSLQLVLIIEPYPPLPPESYAPPSSRLSTRSASITSTARSRTHASRTSRSNISGSRYSSVSRTPDLGDSSSVIPNPVNMRNASKSSTPQPNSRNATGSSTPFGSTLTPGLEEGEYTGRRGATPLFLPGPRDTPFDQDEEDLEAHLAYTEALREGRVRLPSVSRPAGFEGGMTRIQRRVLKRKVDDEAGEEEDDEPEGMERLGERLVRSSQLEEGLIRVQGGWEEGGRAEGIGEEVVEGD